MVRSEIARHASERLEGIKRPYSKEDVERLRGSVQIEYTLARLGAERLWELLHTEDYVQALGALTGNQAVQQVAPASRRSTSPAGRWRPTPTLAGADVPGPEPLPGRQRAARGAAHQPGAAARRPDRARRGQERRLLVRADHGRRRGRLRRAAQRLRADEGDDRGGRRGRALRGPARLEKKCGHMGGKVLVPTQPVHPHARSPRASRPT